jgi:hypothetical protein
VGLTAIMLGLVALVLVLAAICHSDIHDVANLDQKPSWKGEAGGR